MATEVPGWFARRWSLVDRHALLDAACVGLLVWTINPAIPRWPGSAVILGFVAAMVVGMVFGRRALRMLLGGLVLLLLGILFTPVVNRVAVAVTQRCVPDHAEAIVVLEGDRGHGRVIHGLRLWFQSIAPVIATPGSDRHRDGWRNAELAARFGVPVDRLLRPAVERSGTHYEAVALRAAAPALRQIVLVTSPVHSRRAARVFAQNGFSVCSAPTDDASLASNFRDPWGRLLLTRDLVYEGFAAVYYRFRRWI